MSKVIIIGGGAAGMMAGVFAARNHHEVHILEKNEKLGKKVFHHRKRQMQCDKCLRHRRTLSCNDEQSQVPLQQFLFIYSSGCNGVL